MAAEDAFERFLIAFPDYASTAALDDLRAAEYARLDAHGHTYLDYTGAGLHAASQVREHARVAVVRTCSATRIRPARRRRPRRAAVESTRRAVLRWFNATRDYVAVFTQNASAALKLVGESYPFAAGSRLLLTADNHNSVNGIRQFAAARGATVDYAGADVSRAAARSRRRLARLAAGRTTAPRLFAFPAQSNFSGVKHPLDLVSEASRAAGTCCSTRPRSCPPTGSTSTRCSPTSCRSPSTRCSATPPAWAACWRGATRSPA